MTQANMGLIRKVGLSSNSCVDWSIAHCLGGLSVFVGVFISQQYSCFLPSPFPSWVHSGEEQTVCVWRRAAAQHVHPVT